MFKIYFLIILIVKLIYGKINIDIISQRNTGEILVTYSGSDVSLVTDDELRLFNIENKNLKEAVKKHYGMKPTNVFLKGPTPWGDLYKTYHWEPVTRVLSIKSAAIKSINKKPVVVMSHDFENASNNTIKVNTGISQSVENSITTVWSKNKEYTISQEISYDVNVLSGTTGFSWTSSFGESEEKSESVIIGTTSAVETELKPGQAATAILSANRGFMEIEVVYAATLRGNLAVNFKRARKGHHFWGPPIENVLRSGGIVNEVTEVETIKVGYYTDASLKVFDKVSGLPL